MAFFFEESGSGGESGHNCMLNTESRDSAPAFFVDEHEALVDYASFDACYELEAEEEGEDAEEGEAEEEEGGDEEDGSGKRMDMAKAVMATKKVKEWILGLDLIGVLGIWNKFYHFRIYRKSFQKCSNCVRCRMSGGGQKRGRSRRR